MREIKFRGLNNGKWIYGYLRKSEDGTCWISYEFDSLWYELEVDPETVGEYTGLKDKNGKEIYENTILDDRYLCIWWLFSFCLYDILLGDIKDLEIGGGCNVTGSYYEISEDKKGDIDYYLQQAKREVEAERME